MIIIIFPMIYFYAVVAAVVAVGVKLAVFLQRWIIEISIVLWLLITFFSFRSARRDTDSETKVWMYSMPFASVPVLYFVIQSLYDIVLRSSAAIGTFMLFVEFPLSFLCTAAMCMGAVSLGEKFHRYPAIGVLVAVAGNAFILRFLYNIWGPIG